MLKKLNLLELAAVVPVLVFSISICLYHLSYYGRLGIPREAWASVWNLSNNGLLLSLCVTVIIFSFGTVRRMFMFVFAPYFLMKIVYHLFGVYGFGSNQRWVEAWSLGLVLLLLGGFIYFLIIIKKRHA